MQKCGLHASRSDSGVMSSSVSESALSDSGSKASAAAEKKWKQPPRRPRSEAARASSSSPLTDGLMVSSNPSKLRSVATASEEAVARIEREGRSIAIEKAYVHDVYEQISSHIADNKYRPWPRVKQFLQDLEPGSLVCDVGCGSGKYLGINPLVFAIGTDRCQALAQIAREKEHEVMLSDNLALPFRDMSIDAVLSVAVIHHIATAERRVHALRELARVLRVGGRVMITVWAMEQRQRKFESQDVLIPWHKPHLFQQQQPQELAPNSNPAHSTTATSDDDVTHYHAYTQTSDSDQRLQQASYSSSSKLRLSGLRRRSARGTRKAGRSFDPSASDILEAGAGFRPPYQSSSDLSSPSNETCYSFVRRALQKLSSTQQRQLDGRFHKLPLSANGKMDTLSDDGRASSKFMWFSLAGLERLASLQQPNDDDLDRLDSASVLQIQATTDQQEQLQQMAPPLSTTTKFSREDSGESNESSIGDIPIELPHLEDEDEQFHICLQQQQQQSRVKRVSIGRSKSLDMADSSNMQLLKKQSRARQMLRDSGRAFTCDNNDGEEVHKQAGLASADNNKPIKTHSGPNLIEDFKTTISASLKSIDISLRSGSMTSLSSGKSFVSNFSVKSDSGISLPAPKNSQLQEVRQSNSPSKLLSRNKSWESEPLLHHHKKRLMGGKKDLSSFSGANLSEMSLQGEKEKSKAMQSIESKLMNAIKEVNESDLSESNTPINSPGPALLQQQQQQKLQHLSKGNTDGHVEALASVKEVGEAQTQTTFFSSTAGEPAALAVEQTQLESPPSISTGCSKEHLQPPNTSVGGKHRPEEEASSGIISFEELKAKVREMPKLRSLGGRSMEKADSEEKHAGWGKQMSLRDEFLSHERLTANEEMRKQIQKQQSLPDDPHGPAAPRLQRQKSLREGLMQVMSKSRQFESLKQSLEMFRSQATTVTEEREDNLTPKDKEAKVLEATEESPSDSEATQNKGSTQPPQISGQAIKSGIVRIWQSWRSSDKTDGPSFTHKRGVSIQPIEVRRDGGFLDGGGASGAAGRRSLFQRRRGGSSPLSPQQLEALACKDESTMSPTSFRRCCLDCPSGDLVIVEQTSGGSMRERKLSRGGGEASDSSSKDGSIQSDTSIDSEDSCVSVIFVPHPDGKFGLTGEPVPELFNKLAHRKRSNSSESSESTQSSPIMSPGIRKQSVGSPTKNASLKPSSTMMTKLDLIRQSMVQFDAIVSMNEDGSCSETVYCLTDRPLEKIDERHTEESESEAENTVIQTIAAKDEEEKITVAVPEREAEDKPKESPEKELAPKIKDQPIRVTEEPKVKALLHKRLSCQKSFEMEDIPHENPIKCHPANLSSSSSQKVRVLKPSKARHRAPQPLPPKPRYDYPIVRHHPLFAKQSKPGEGQSNFSSLLLGNNVRIIRGHSLSSNESTEDKFEIFNPEVDDSDSDSDNKDCSLTSDEDEEKSSSSPSSSINSDASVESVVSASKPDDASNKGDTSPNSQSSSGKDPYQDEDLEISRRAEQRRKILLSLLDENQSVLSVISQNKKRPSSISEEDKLAAQRATGAIPKKPLPAIVEPVQETRKKRTLNKAKSVCSSPIDINVPSISKAGVVRQSSVPGKLEDVTNVLVRSQSNSMSSSSSCKTSPAASNNTANNNYARTHLSPGASDTSGIQSKDSHESLTESTDSISDPKKSKSPSPSRSKAPTLVPNLPALPNKKLGMKRAASVEDHPGSVSGSISKQGSVDLPTLDEEGACLSGADIGGSHPMIVHRRALKRATREDSIESNAPSAKSSVQYSDTSSLLSHRFSTISISSNVSSSDVSISASGGQSGSSCYLASMSSADFDDRPALASSFSLSEAEVDSSSANADANFQQPKVKLKMAYKRTPLLKRELPSTEEERSNMNLRGCGGTSDHMMARSRIGTEICMENNSLDLPSCVEHGESFEEEMQAFCSKDDDDDDVMLDSAMMRQSSKSRNGSSNNSSLNRASLSAASSNESLQQSDSGGSQTFHRYYHVFREGELDYLINTYVDNLHIISSYYDHANWCIVAEKVNVWTI